MFTGSIKRFFIIYQPKTKKNKFFKVLLLEDHIENY